MPKIGDIVKGKVVKILPKRAIVELGNSQSGYIHISHVSKRNKGFVRNIGDHLKLGQVIDVRVILFKPEKNQYELSIKYLDNELYKDERFKNQMKEFLEVSAERLSAIQRSKEKKQGIKRTLKKKK